MSAPAVFTYSGQDVRTVLVDGEPWFVLADLCRVLGLTTPARVLERLDDGVSLAHPISDRLGREQLATVVSEAGMYEVVIRSDKPQARDFRRWITSEVLPSIRRTGSYGAPAPRELSRLELIDLAREAELGRLAAEEKVAALEPAANAWETVTTAAGADYSVGEAAKVLTNSGWVTGPQRLFNELEALGWIFKREKHWQATQRRIEQKLLTHRLNPPFFNRATGEYQASAPQVRVTAKGIERLLAIYQERTGQLAIPPANAARP